MQAQLKARRITAKVLDQDLGNDNARGQAAFQEIKELVLIPSAGNLAWGTAGWPSC